MARVAIVTGTGDISASALHLAEAGLDVALLAPDENAGVAERITGLGRRAHAVSAELTDGESVEKAIAEIGAVLGDPDILVNVADGPLEGPLNDDWYPCLDAAFKGVFLASRAVVDAMIKNGGGTILTLSGADASLQAGLSGFTRTIAAELKPFGITANLLASGALPLFLGKGASAVTGQVVGT